MFRARSHCHPHYRGADDGAQRKVHHREVTHNMQQAMRVADQTAFFSVDISRGGRTGYLVEFGKTRQIFEDPKEELTKKYISGQFS